ncbi:DUF1697-domain-containing protein [Fragilariopsis cylindrus CCMP1102]|uniref:DUF1697-domain-containing protein n=1 Tax=Fragilariopsis cylindrus CCMP1102 TaxID=635003 RepID=A0A1E7FVF9_9STRA|nr:DUF1697-domain-containing protein [Fragilariopsis cylindrus CCMP1102]|eukprot:OEU22148.1 DUF1697-domain-containing protein [Fragilariopsis cylindrus CCMP1102]
MENQQTYVALLRGINVNGHRVMKMADLRASLEHHSDSFSHVKTWIQTGNVIFQSSRNSQELKEKIKEVILQDFGLDDVPVMIRTGQEIKEALANNPFAERESKRIFIAFLDQKPRQDLMDEMGRVNYSTEEYVLSEKNDMIYFYIPNFAKYKLDTTLFEKKLQLKASSRNWRTTTKLAELASAMELSEKAETTDVIAAAGAASSGTMQRMKRRRQEKVDYNIERLAHGRTSKRNCG